MTALLVIGIIVGYLAVGIAVARAAYHNDRLGIWALDDNDQWLAGALVLLWPLAMPFAALVAFSGMTFRLVTMPNRRERLAARHDKAQASIAALEKELGMADAGQVQRGCSCEPGSDRHCHGCTPGMTVRNGTVIWLCHHLGDHR